MIAMSDSAFTFMMILIVTGSYALAAVIFIVHTIREAFKPGGEMDQRAKSALSSPETPQ